MAIGGNQIPGGSPGNLVVWAVTAHGRVFLLVLLNEIAALSLNKIVENIIYTILLNICPSLQVMFRVGVSSTSPEGQRWSAIKLSPGHEVSQVSVGVSGLVWAILQNGKAIVRIGVTRENPMGKKNLAKKYRTISH